MDVRGGFLAAGDVEFASARRAATDKDGVIIFGNQRLHAVDAVAEPQLRLEIGDVADFLIEHAFGQTELGNLRAHHATGMRIGIVHDAAVAERQKVAGNGERRGPRADQRNALAVLGRTGGGQAVAYLALVVAGDALKTADRNRILLDAAASAGGLAGAIAGAAQNSREHV